VENYCLVLGFKAVFVIVVVVFWNVTLRILVSKCRLKFCFGTRFPQVFINILMRTVSGSGAYTQSFTELRNILKKKTYFGVGYMPWSEGLFSNRLNLLR